MKRFIPFISLVFLLLVSSRITAQNVAVSDGSGKWLLGLNWGGAWERSDVRARMGQGLGVTLERTIIENNTSTFGFSLRGRYLHTWMWGKDNQRYYGVANEDNLNGTNYPSINYTGAGYVFRNHFTKTDEFSLEGLLILNRLRATSAFKIYGFGGINATGYTSKINQLDATGSMYDYSGVSTFSTQLAKSDLNLLYDQTHETNAEKQYGGRNHYVIAGSIGLGVGIKLSPRVYLGLEHKFTFTSTDMLDGTKYNLDQSLSPKNDRYHYSSLFLSIGLGKGYYGSGNTDYDYNQQTTQNYNTTPAPVYKPVITIVYPHENPHFFMDCKAEIKASIDYITSVNDITVLKDGAVMYSSDYSYDQVTRVLTIRSTLTGNSVFTITATNTSGQDTKYVYANCRPETVPVMPAPVISILTSNGNACIANITASVQHVSDITGIDVIQDGITLTSNQYTFNPYNGTVVIQSPFSQYTSVTIRARNATSTVVETVNLSCTPAVITPRQMPPVIIVTNPSTSPFIAVNCVATVEARIEGIASANDISVLQNGVTVSAVNYSFNPSSLVFRLQLPVTGNTTFSIQARNAAGVANASVVIQCVPPQKINPPVITRIKPSASDFTSLTCKEKVMVQIANINSVQDVTVLANGLAMDRSLLTYDPTSRLLSFNTVVQQQTIITITAFNGGGTATETIRLTCKTADLPQIIINSPAGNPYVSASCGEQIHATVKGIENVSQLRITLNGIPVTANVQYNANTDILTFPVNFAGRSELIITATNAGGSISSALTLVCQPPVSGPTVQIVSPAGNPYSSEGCAETVTAIVKNVESVNNIRVTLNGQALATSLLTFDKTSGTLQFPVTFTGDAVAVITATNTSSSAAQTLVLQCKPVLTPEIILINPAAENYTSTTCNEQVLMTIKNISSADQLKITVNGKVLPSSAYSFDAANSLLKISTVVDVKSVIVVTATNKTKVAAKTVTIICKKTPAPAVTITGPVGNPYISENCTETVTAVVQNVESVNNITVTANGQAIPSASLTFNNTTGALQFPVTFTGSSVVIITAVNNTSVASQSLTLQCQPVLLPVITLVNPASDTYTSATCQETITMNIKNITSIEQLKVTVNGQVLSSASYTFDVSSGMLKIPSAIEATSVIVVTAANKTKIATKTVTITCKKTPAPSITITAPSGTPYVSLNCNETVKASLTNIESADQIRVTVNGQPLAASAMVYTKTNGNLQFPVPFTGDAAVVITAANSTSSVSASLTLLCRPVLKPEVQIVTPSSGLLVSKTCLEPVKAQLKNVKDLSEITVTSNGTVLNTSDLSFDAATNVLQFQSAVQTQNVIVITVKNSAGVSSASVTIQCKPTPLPAVSILAPAGTVKVSATCSEDIQAAVTNVSSIDQIDVTFNGTAIPKTGMKYDTATHQLRFTYALKADGDLVIRATNDAGTDSKKVTLQCRPVLPPQLVVTSPATEPFVSETCSEKITATFKNIESADGIVVTANNVPLPKESLTFDKATGALSFLVAFTVDTEIKITGTNVSGTVSKSIHVSCKPVLQPEIAVSYPSADPFTTNTCKEEAVMQVKNIESIQQIKVSINGQVLSSGYTFDAGSGLLKIPVAVENQSVILVTATNKTKVATKTVTIICKKIPPPEVIINSPAGNPFLSESCSEKVTATVHNVESVTNITVTLNGKAIPAESLTFNNTSDVLQFQATFTGDAVVTITAVNNTGSVSQTLALQCKPVLAPEITVVAPTTETYTSSVCQETVLMTIRNIISAEQIKVTVNGQVLSASAYTFEAATGLLKIPVSVETQSVISVTATNKTKVATKAVTIICKKVLPPLITISSPAGNPYISEACSEKVTAVVQHVESVTGIKVTQNGQTIPSASLSFDPATGVLQFPSQFTGDAVIIITASNAASTVTQTLTLQCKPVLVPSIALVNPVTENYTSTSCKEDVMMTIRNITSADQIKVTVNGQILSPSLYTFDVATNVLKIPSAIEATSVIAVTATNKTKVATKTVTITCKKVPAPTVAITSPAEEVANLENCSATVSATLTGIDSKDQIIVTVNGTIISNASVSYANNILNIPVSVSQRSEVLITAKNSAGQATDKVILVCNTNTSYVVPGPTGNNCSSPEKPFTNCSTCNETVSVTAGTINVEANKKVCITNSFDGSVNMNGGQLVICGTASIHNINYNAGDIVVTGNASFDNINMNNNSSALRNYGTLVISNITFNGRVENHGQLTVKGDFNVNAGAVFKNTGTMQAQMSFNNNNYVCNSGTINIAANLKVNGAAEFNNQCKVLVSGQVNIDNIFNNNGSVKVSGITFLNGPGKLTMGNSTKWICGGLMFNGTLNGPGAGCASVTVNGETRINGSAKVSGKIDICDNNGIEALMITLPAGVTTDCSCTLTQSGSCAINDELNDKVTICHIPPGNTGNPQTLTVSRNALAAHLAHGDHIGSCTQQDTDAYNQKLKQQQQQTNPAGTGDGGTGQTQPATPAEEEKVTICHIPPGNTGNPQTITVAKSAVAAHLAHGDHLGSCTQQDIDAYNEKVKTQTQPATPAEEEKVTICHIPPGNTGNPQTITVAKSAVAAHLAHGDHLGSCTQQDIDAYNEKVKTQTQPATPAEEEKVTICHIPPGNTGNPQTITVAKSAVAAHLAHGDHLGSCTQEDADAYTKKQQELKARQDLEEQQRQQQLQEQERQKQLQLKQQQEEQERLKQQQLQQQQQQTNPGGTGDGGTGQTQPATPAEEEKVTICHIPPGNTGNPQTITVAKSAVAAHLAHGDHLGSCTQEDADAYTKKQQELKARQDLEEQQRQQQLQEQERQKQLQLKQQQEEQERLKQQQLQQQQQQTNPGGTGDGGTGQTQPTSPAEEEKVTICHIPPGNTGNPQTITVSKSAVPAHLAHGDHLGSCTQEDTDAYNKKLLEIKQKQEQERLKQLQLKQQQEEQERLKQLQLQQEQEQQQQQTNPSGNTGEGDAGNNSTGQPQNNNGNGNGNGK